MKLYQLKIDGVLFNPQESYTAEQLNGNQAIVVAVSNPNTANYEEITSMLNWNTFGNYVINYREVRIQIKALLDALGADETTRWAACTANEKIVIAQYFLVSNGLIFTVLSQADFAKYWECHVTEMITGRKTAWEKFMGSNSAYLTVEQRIDAQDTLGTMITNYIIAGDAKLIDWFNSTGIYTPNLGFVLKPYFSQTILNNFNALVF